MMLIRSTEHKIRISGSLKTNFDIHFKNKRLLNQLV